MKDNTAVKDNVKVVLKGPDGKVKQQITGHNLVVNDGQAHVADQLASTPSDSAMSHMAIGEGTNAVSATQTALQDELDRTTLDSRTSDSDTVTYQASWGPGAGTGAITEYGIFNDSSAGTMLARFVDNVINKGEDDSLEVEWTVTFNIPS